MIVPNRNIISSNNRGRRFKNIFVATNMNTDIMKTRMGLSLPYTYLSDNNVETDNIFVSSLGPADAALSQLKGRVEYIELSNFSVKASAEQIVSAVTKIWKHGLKVTLHPSLPQNVKGKDLIRIYPWLEKLLPVFRKYQTDLMLNLHALAAPVGDEAQLSKDSIINLKVIAELIESSQLPLRVAVELNRSKGIADPCTTYEGVLKIFEQVNSAAVGIGWDIGHTFSNYQNGLIGKILPEEFLKNIIHTHIHDMSPDGKTHWPLTMGTVPLAESMGLLKEHNYTGLYVLEFQPLRFAGHGDVKDLIYASIDRLSDVI